MLSSKSKTPPSKLTKVHAEWSFEAIGTSWWIGIYMPITAAKLTHLKRIIAERIESFDKTYSRFRTDSLVAQIAHQAGTYDMPEDSLALLNVYEKLYKQTGGAVTPLIGQVLSDAGYDADYSLQPGQLKTPPSWEETLSFKNGKLTAYEPVLLDFGAAGKGYLVDIVGEILADNAISQFCIDASGDMLCRNLPQEMRIGLEHPADPSQVLGVAQIRNGVLCGSAGNRRKWGKYHHIMSPHTLESPKAIQAVWVAAESALLADGLTTALFFAEPDTLAQTFTFSYVIVYADNTMTYSPNFPAEFFESES